MLKSVITNLQQEFKALTEEFSDTIRTVALRTKEELGSFSAAFASQGSDLQRRIEEALTSAYPGFANTWLKSFPHTSSTAAELDDEFGEAAPVLLAKALRANDSVIRDLATSLTAEWLGHVNNVNPSYTQVCAPTLVPALFLALSDVNDSSRYAAAGALGSLGAHAEMAVAKLSKIAATDHNTFVRGQALLALGQIACYPEIAVPVLIDALKEVNKALCQYAARSLGAFGARASTATSAIIALQSRLANDTLVAMDAIQALGKINPPPEIAVPMLCEMLRRDDTHVRRSACISLGALGRDAQAALGYLRSLLWTTPNSSDEAEFIRNAIAKIEA